ncbi:hypothetical protein PENTCL1PPCAC_18181 [Pristionchus entomophagus]|uniref:Ric-8 n=1 Tax=Pristionchus entomophagus TaxID=358040 RepID=A0AAV5TNX9_9BILA|nr:hypothetical protein PENTCL1PPCAC_18181 [Pristionchus entomophagus]
MEEKQLIKKLSEIAQAANSQKEFSYYSEFKRKLSSMMCKRWPNASSSLRKGFCIILRCLCRERTCIDVLLSREIMENVIGSTGLPACCEADLPEDERLEAVKCLINAFFHHKPSILVFTELSCLDGLGMASVREKDGEKRYLLLHLIFVVSARLDEAQNHWRGDASLVHLLCEESLKWEKLVKNADEALKILFNLFCHCNGKGDEAILEECLQMARRVLLTAPRRSSQIQNTVNLLGCLPINVDFFYPRIEDGESVEFSFDGRDMKVAQVVMDDLGDRLREDKWEGVELLGTYFTFLITSASKCKAVRRYCRIKIIPPLTAADVERPPERGDTMRNKIIRLMHSSSQPRELAAQFMYVLCKRSVNRLIKYTGLGNAAGLLANSGLLGRINEGRRASDSEDSETEDYKEVEERVNPVTGYVREERPDPMEGMSEEQKEHEAMKLVQAMDRLLGEGIIKPSTIGPDGRPTTVSHVLELVKNVKTPEGSDSDSD